MLSLWLLAGAALAKGHKITLSLQDMPLREVMQMLSRQERVNILVSDGVDARVSFNLYAVDVDEAIRAITEAAGFAVEYRDGTYYIVKRDQAGSYAIGDLTRLKTFKVQYTKPEQVAQILKKHLSRYGKITTLADRGLIVVEDKPSFLRRIGRLLAEVDREPKQILIEAKILEITLRDNESFGIDWAKLFTIGQTDGTLGVQGLGNGTSPGLLFRLVSPNVRLALDALKARGRLRTLSTPKLLALENQEASTVVGDRLGFRVTTTINQVTTESIDFLESGVILRVKPSVDRQGRILLDVHPEVSTGSISKDGIPSKRTTQVSTQMLVPDGQTVFIGGLIKRSVQEGRNGVPVLGDLPGVGLMFSSRSKQVVSTETVVLITPRIVRHRRLPGRTRAFRDTERDIEADRADAQAEIHRLMDGPKPSRERPATASPGPQVSPSSTAPTLSVQELDY